MCGKLSYEMIILIPKVRYDMIWYELIDFEVGFDRDKVGGAQ